MSLNVMNRSHLSLCLLLALGGLSGCAVGPNFKSPTAPPKAADSFVGAQGSTYVTEQSLPPYWWRLYNDPILDRLVHNAHRLALDGPSMRDPKTAKSDTTAPGPSATDTTVTKPPTGAKK